MKKQDELNLFALLLERQRRAALGKSEGECQDADGIYVADMGHCLEIPYKRILAITDKWERTPWWEAFNDTPWGYIVSKRGHKLRPGEKPCAAFPATLEAFAGRPAETTVDVVTLIDGLITERREKRLAEEARHRKQKASFDEVMASIKSKAAAPDQTVQAPMSVNIAMASADPEQIDAFVQHLVVIGQKASHSTQEYLARQANSKVCQDALRILREKGIV